MNYKKKIVAFDFDGTITKKDSFIELIRYVHGDWHFVKGLLVNFITLVAYILHIYPNWKAKQRLFSYFFKKMPISEFNAIGEKFINSRSQNFFNLSALEAIEQYKRDEYIVVVISASAENWIRPFAEKHGIEYVIGTKLALDKKKNITGVFLTKNCYGEEKVNRLLQLFPDRTDYYLVAYGDSKGDKELLNFADKAFRKFRYYPRG